jgi:hypothetical protein
VPIVKSLSAIGGNLKNYQVRIDGPGCFLDFFYVAVKIRQQIHFADQKNIGFLEHEGVFVRFVVSLCNTEHHNLAIFANFKLSRTDKVADIFNNYEVQRIEV